MKIALVLCAVLLTIIFSVVLVYLICLLIKLIETVSSVNVLLKKITPEIERLLNTVNNIITMVDTVKNFVEGISLRWTKRAGVIVGFLKGLGFVLSILRKRKEDSTQETKNKN